MYLTFSSIQLKTSLKHFCFDAKYQVARTEICSQDPAGVQIVYKLILGKIVSKQSVIHLLNEPVTTLNQYEL